MDREINNTYPLSEKEKKIYNKWRLRILILVVFGYGAYYLCRQNFSMIMPVYMEEFGHSKSELGMILSIASLVYGVGKFANGYISDRSNARYFMPAGLFASGVISIFLGFTNSLWSFAILWMMNNWAQSMGWPPAARMLTHWFAPTELGRKWALGAASHQVGGALTIIFAGYLATEFSWRYAFYIPGIMSAIMAIILFYGLRESPFVVGLPSVEVYKNVALDHNEHNSEKDTQVLSSKELFDIVFLNKRLWLLCCANMCVYIVRIGIIFWAPVFLKEFKNLSLTDAGWRVAAYECFGLIGGITAGWVSDKIFHGSRGIVGCVFMLGLAINMLIFWQMPLGYNNLGTIALILAGFFVYGPQVLVGVASADFASKQAVGTANGFVGTMGYVGSAIAAACVGWLIDHLGWNSVFCFFILASMIGSYLFYLTSCQAGSKTK